MNLNQIFPTVANFNWKARVLDSIGLLGGILKKIEAEGIRNVCTGRIFLPLQGLIFYLPRLFWLKQEEGRMNAISDGVRVGSVIRCDDDNEKIRNVGKNVADYLMLDQAGHFFYGFNYILAQVGQCMG